MKALTESKAIELIDSGRDVPFEYIENNVYIQFRGEEEVWEGKDLILFIENFLGNMVGVTRDEDLKYKLNYSIAHRTLQGKTLNLLISECRGIAYQNSL